MTGDGLDRLLARGAHRVGPRLAALYRRWDGQGGADLPAVAGCLLMGMDGADTPPGQACLRLAAAAARWGGHPYHSAGHHAEVATNATVLAGLAARAGRPVAAPNRVLLLAAALAHDLHYEPAWQPRPRFAAEAASAAAADAIAADCGVAPAQRDVLRVLILATEPAFRAVLASPGALPGGLPPGMDALATRPDLAELARLLSDADLLSSAGLTVGWHAVQLRRLEREGGRPITPAADLAFLDGVVGDRFVSCGGGGFTVNLQRIREAVRRRIAAASDHPLSEYGL